MSPSPAPAPSFVSVTVDAMPSGLDVDVSTNTVFVDGQQNGTITLLNGQTGAVVAGPLPLAGSSSSTCAPHGVSVDSSTHVALVANQGNDTVSIVTPGGSTATIATVKLAKGSQPHGVAVNAATGFAYVANQGTNTMSAIDLTATPPAEIKGSPVETGSNPHGIGVDAVNNLVFVANRKDGTVSIFTGAIRDTTSAAGHSTSTITPPALVSTVTVGTAADAPTGIGVNAATSKAYVSLNTANSVVVLAYAAPNSPSSPALTPIASVGQGPDRFCVNTNTNDVYVSDNLGSQVTAITPNDTVGGTVTVGSANNASAPTEMGFLPSTGLLYVAVQNDNLVVAVNPASFSTSNAIP
jgi:DNA-binding beta-propeller fold protein YncE